MISQAALSLTVSPVHTVDYYTNLADTLVEMGADEICIKDMAGIGRPATIGKIIKISRKDIPLFLFNTMVMQARVFRWLQFWSRLMQVQSI